MQTGNTHFIYKNELDKACFQHDMAYGKLKDLIKRTQSDKPNEPNYQLANELHKSIIRKFKKTKVYSSFRDNIWGVDLADMQSLSKYNKRIKYIICPINLFSKYAWVIPIKDKKGTGIVSASKTIISEKNEAESKGRRKPNTIWVDQGSEFDNKSFKDFLKIKNIEYIQHTMKESVLLLRDLLEL